MDGGGRTIPPSRDRQPLARAACITKERLRALCTDISRCSITENPAKISNPCFPMSWVWRLLVAQLMMREWMSLSRDSALLTAVVVIEEERRGSGVGELYILS